MPSSFVKLLKKYPSTPEYDNLYRGRSKAAQVRRYNLELYLSKMKAYAPKLLLVGEAPGYKGCKLTGVPFSSESLLLENHKHPILGITHGYKCLSTSQQLENERSAAMVWNSLNQHKLLPLIWNIFPFHPHLLGIPHSNRSPRVAEIRTGAEILKRLLELFSISSIAAVGRKAYKGISELDLESTHVTYVRHPSYGGKKKFEEGIASLAKEGTQF